VGSSLCRLNQLIPVNGTETVLHVLAVVTDIGSLNQLIPVNGTETLRYASFWIHLQGLNQLIPVNGTETLVATLPDRRGLRVSIN